jgi:hypothetical protein
MEVKMHPEIEKALTDKGEAWCVAALVEGSIGYHDPYDAARMIKRYREGERQNFCERCYCLYGGDLEKMLLDDIRKFLYFEENCPESFKRVKAFIDAWAKRPEEPFGGVTGLMYPTIV